MKVLCSTVCVTTRTHYLSTGQRGSGGFCFIQNMEHLWVFHPAQDRLECIQKTRQSFFENVHWCMKYHLKE